MTSVTYPEAMGACDVVMARNSVFGGCWRRVKAQSYRDEYVRAVGPHGRHLEDYASALHYIKVTRIATVV